MDYYNEKYERMCLEESDNRAVDIVIKGNKIYKVNYYNFTLETDTKLNEFIDVLTIKKNFIHDKSTTYMTTLIQLSTGHYVNIYKKFNNGANSSDRIWDIEYIEPQVISSVN